MTYKYEYTEGETNEAMKNGNCWVCEKPLNNSYPLCCKGMMYQYGCNGCGGSFDPNYGGEIEEETGRPNMCATSLDKGMVME